MYKVSACFLTGACVEKKQHLENGYLKRKLLTQTFWTIFFSTQGPSLGFFLVFAVSMYRLCTNSTQGGVNKFKLVKSKDWFLYFFSDCRKMIWTNLLTVSLMSDCLTTDLKYFEMVVSKDSCQSHNFKDRNTLMFPDIFSFCWY